MPYMKWSEPAIKGTTPKIKNHSATLVDNSLFVFGGYDAHRNHSTVHIFDCETYTWRVATNISGKAPVSALVVVGGGGVRQEIELSPAIRKQLNSNSIPSVICLTYVFD